ncbi:MAG: catalase [Clostridiales bacterium]|nr:catalase [Clostridiales bacterium]
MTDFLLLEEISKLIGRLERPRLMHRKGICAGGYFRPYMSLSDYTKAELFLNPDRATDVAVRFSSMLGGEGTADTSRNIKGLSVKFSHEDGSYDLICQSIPVYFINDETKFPDLHRALSDKYSFDGGDKRKLWDFAAANPESINCILRLYSFCGLSSSFTDIVMYSVNTYIWKNSKDRKYLVRYKWVPLKPNGVENVGDKRINSIFAEFMAGFDPDIATEQMISHIESGKFPQYELHVQLIDYEYINDSSYIKTTLCWNEDVIKSFPVGIMKLTKILRDSEDGKKAQHFSPTNLIDGIEMCGDDFTKVMGYSHNMGANMRGVL